jgi:hypothetical protein
MGHRNEQYTVELVYVPGTSGAPYAFGNGDAVRSIELPGFFIQTTPVTQALWIHVLGADANPSIHQGVDFPVENVSWESITRPGGFLDRIKECGSAGNLAPCRSVQLSSVHRKPRQTFRP